MGAIHMLQKTKAQYTAELESLYPDATKEYINALKVSIQALKKAIHHFEIEIENIEMEHLLFNCADVINGVCKSPAMLSKERAKQRANFWLMDDNLKIWESEML